MVSVPSSIILHASGGGQQFELKADIISTNNPMQGNNYLYAAGNRRTIFQASPASEFSGALTCYSRVPISLTDSKTAVTVYADIETGSVKFEIFNAAGASQGSVTLTDGATRSVQNGNVTGLTPSSVDYCTVTTTGGSVKLYQIQAYEVALTSI